MGAKLARVLDECFVRTSKGESIDACLSDYANVREQLEPLLHTAMSIASMPKVVPSDNFRKTAKGRLMARLHQETNQRKIVTLDERVPLFDALAMAGQRLWQAMAGARKIAIPVTLTLLLAIAASLGTSNFISPSPTLASQCTLSIFSGNVEVRPPRETARSVVLTA